MLTHDGFRVLLHNMLGGDDMRVRLFVNDVTPKVSDTIKLYKEPPREVGYTPHRCEPDDWEIPDPKKLLIRYPEIVFRFSGAVGRVYGYFVTQQAVLIWANRFDDDAPVFMKRDGDAIYVVPEFVWRPKGDEK